MSEDLERLEAERAGLAEAVPSQALDLYDLEEYQGEIETHYWIPDKSQPTKKIRLDLRIQALKGSDQNVISREVNEANMRGQQINHLQEQLQRMKPPREIEKKDERLRAISRFDYEGDEEKAEQEREKLDAEIKSLMGNYQKDYEALEAKIRTLIAQPSFYEILRTKLFLKVIADHSIGIKRDGGLVKVDLNSNLPENELSDSFAAGLQEFIYEVLRRGKQKARNGIPKRH